MSVDSVGIRCRRGAKRPPWNCARRDKSGENERLAGGLGDPVDVRTRPVLFCPDSTAVVSQRGDEGGESVVGHGCRLRRNLAAAAPPPKVVALPTIPSPIARHLIDGLHVRYCTASPQGIVTSCGNLNGDGLGGGPCSWPRASRHWRGIVVVQL